MKLVSIMILLIISLMAVVCVFLLRGVRGFYLNEFYDQMSLAFSDPEMVTDLKTAAAGDNAPGAMTKILRAYSGVLGIDTGTRNYYILDGATGELITGSEEGADMLEISPNILTALTGEAGYESDPSAAYMDVALPIETETSSYIIYIKDNKQTVTDLNMELFLMIMEALIIGLVFSILLSFVLSKTMIIPVQNLTRAAEKVASGDFSEQIEVQARDEIGTLTRTFNNMAARLKTTLEDIENERSKLSTVFLHMTDGVVAFSPAGEAIHHNPAAERLLGMSFTPEPPEYDGVFGDIVPLKTVMELKSPDFFGAERATANAELEIFLAPFTGEGAPGGVLAVIHDITAQKKSDEMRKEFVANVSHELRTPLTNIRSYAETLSDTKDVPEDMRRNFLRVIINESDRMTKIVQDLLTLSRFDAGGTSGTFSKFSIRNAVNDVCESVKLEARKHGHTLNTDLESTLPKIMGDRARIEQVILNIVTNALKYTPDGGHISVKAAKEGGTVRITVSDDGIGIPEKDLPRIFERFYRVDKARSRASGGTGLGLAIAKEIISQHGGTINIQSRPGAGTEVTIDLPIS